MTHQERAYRLASIVDDGNESYGVRLTCMRQLKKCLNKAGLNYTDVSGGETNARDAMANVRAYLAASITGGKDGR